MKTFNCLLFGTVAQLLQVVQVAQAEEARVLPLTIEAQLPQIEVRIDDQPARLLIDLGGGAALALRPSWPGLGTQATVKLADGSVETLPTRPWPKAQRPAGIDGYLGYGYLSRYSLVIDYPQKQLLLVPPGRLAAVCTGKPAPLLQLGSLPYCRFETSDGQTLALGLDTGANVNVLKPAVQPAPGLLRLAGQALEPGGFTRVELAVPVVAGFLGYDFFARHRVCLDAASQKFSVWPSP